MTGSKMFVISDIKNSFCTSFLIKTFFFNLILIGTRKEKSAIKSLILVGQVSTNSIWIFVFIYKLCEIGLLMYRSMAPRLDLF